MTIASINPATGKVLKTFEPLSCVQLQAKLALAASTFESFRKTSFADRARWMNKAADILEAEKETFAKLMTLEMGKTFKSAVDEAVKCATGCRYYAENAETLPGRRNHRHQREAAATCSYQPHGCDSGHHAVEFSLLAGVPLHRARPDGGQRGLAEARFQRSAVRPGD